MPYCNAAHNQATEQQDTLLHQDPTVVITETDSLKLYKPIFYGGIGLCCGCGEEPPMGMNHIFVAAAAYTKSYNWTKFNHNLIAGPHIDKEYNEGYDCEANTGAFYYVHSSKRWCLPCFIHGHGSMRFSAYKEHLEADWIEIHPRNAMSRYATNYLVFYYAD